MTDLLQLVRYLLLDRDKLRLLQLHPLQAPQDDHAALGRLYQLGRHSAWGAGQAAG